MKKSIYGAIQVLLIAMLLMTTIKSFDMTSTTKGQEIAVDSMSTSTNQTRPIVFIFLHDDSIVDDVRGSALNFLEETKADVVYRPLTTWGESVDLVQSRWSQNEWFIQECHKMNVQVIPVISTCILHPEDFNSTFITSAATRNASGQIITQYQGAGIPYYYHGCLNHLVWREHLFQVAKVAVDLGVDGIEFDEPSDRWWWTGECYTDECIGQFKEYLQTKYMPNELQGKFGINDISAFNYREYLASKGLLYVDEQERLYGNDPLGREYYVFELSTLARNFKELTSRIKDYAKKAYGRDLIIVANQWELSNDNLIDYPQVDFLSIGTCLNVWYMDKDRREGRKYYPPYYTASPFILLARGLDSRKQAVMFPDIYDYANVNLTSTVTKIIIGEAYAFGGYFNLPFYSGTDYGPTDTLINFTHFIRRYSEFYQPSVYPFDVALFTPYTTMLWVPGFPQQIYGASQILADAHIPFDMLFTGDGNVLPDTLTLGDLMKYKVIYLPDILSHPT